MMRRISRKNLKSGISISFLALFIILISVLCFQSLTGFSNWSNLGTNISSNRSLSNRSESMELVCMIYFTGIGCPHCAKTDPVIFKEIVREYNLTIIEYEIYQTQGNGGVMLDYADFYNKNEWFGIPLVIFSKDRYIIGDSPILQKIREVIEGSGGNKCLLLGKEEYPSQLDINSLPGKPKIWVGERVLVKGENYLSNNVSLSLLYSKDPTEVLKEFKDVEQLSHPCMPYSGGEVCFEHGVKFNGDWEFVWNGKGLE